MRPGTTGGNPDVKEDLNRTVDATKQHAADLGDQARRAAGDAATEAKRQARQFGEDQKDRAAGSVDGMASALRSAAEDLDQQERGAVAGYARQAASGLDSISDALSRQSVDDLVHTVEDFARRQPAAFLGGAVLSGFVLARFAKSSAERRHAETYAGAGPRPYEPESHRPYGSDPLAPTSRPVTETPLAGGAGVATNPTHKGSS
jgi:hypothetical protein